MSKRITLSERECEYIMQALLALKNETGLSYSVVKVGQIVYQDIIDKINKRIANGEQVT